MSNTLGTLSSALIIQEALSLVFTKRPLLKKISKDLAPQGALLNQQVISRIHTVPSVGNFGSGITSKVDTDVPVTLNKFKQVGYSFTAAELNATDRNLVQESAEPIAVAMANDIIDSVAALYLGSNFSNYTLDATPSYTTLVNMRKALIGRGNHGDRFAVVNPDVYALLLEDPLCNRFYKVMGNDPIVDGELAQVAGFSNIFEYPSLPTTDHLTGFAGTMDSVVFAGRVPKDPREALPNAPLNGNIEIITDPISGLSVMAVEQIDVATLSATVYLAYIYGVAVGNPVAGQRLVSA